MSSFAANPEVVSFLTLSDRIRSAGLVRTVPEAVSVLAVCGKLDTEQPLFVPETLELNPYCRHSLAEAPVPLLPEARLQ